MSPVVVLVGPPGAGKSTVGALVADALGVAFRDADADVEAAAGKTITEIFTEDGEPAFRALERAAVLAGLASHPGVLALGGGAVLADETRAALRGHPVVYLSVGMAEGVRRTGLSTARPLITGVNPRSTFKALLDARLPLYREVAEIEVVTDELTADEVAQAVVLALATAESS